MNFQSARCETCGQYIFKADDCVAYKRTRDKCLESIKLHGQEPWSGVCVICFKCVQFFRSVDL